MMSWTVWYIQAILLMAEVEAKDLLVRLLSEPEYESDAAWGLFQLARGGLVSFGVWPRFWPMRNKDFSLISKIRLGQAEVEFSEPLRTEVALLVKKHMEGRITERAASEHPSSYDLRLKELAVVLAELDGKASANLVLDILSVPEAGRQIPGAMSCIGGLEALLMRGVVLPSAKTWAILDPIIQHVKENRWNDHALELLVHVAGIVLFTDDASASIVRLQELLKENLFRREGVRTLTRALGYSHCDTAAGLLRDIVEDKVHVQHSEDIWVDAVAHLGTQESCNLLLSFVDPSLPPAPTELMTHYNEILVMRLRELAQRDANVQRRLFELVHFDLSVAQATLLGSVLANMGTIEAILCALELLKDDRPGGPSYELHKAIEKAFVEQRPHQGSAHTVTMVPRTSNSIRSRLLDMFEHDPQRRESAFELLIEIEKWRMWHGRPDGEPRSPMPQAGFLWPPEI